MTVNKSNYHHGDLASALMETAIKRIAQQGVDKLSLRAVARDLDVSQTALYRHFDNKTHLLNVLAQQGFQRLRAHTAHAASQHKGNTLKGMMALGMAYIEFAQQHPEHYRLMFGGVIKRDSEENSPFINDGLSAFDVILQFSHDAVERGEFIKQSPRLLARHCWAKVHGISMLLIDGFYTDLSATQLNALLRELLWLDLRAMSAKPLPHSEPRV